MNSHDLLPTLTAATKAKLGLSALAALAALDASDDNQMRTGELAAAIGVSSASITGIVDNLIERGLVDRWNSTIDRRVQYVELTDHGHGTLLNILFPPKNGADGRISNDGTGLLAA